MLPDGLRYLDSCIAADDNLDRCFQFMETDDPALFQTWLANWSDLVTLDVVPVIKSRRSSTTRERLMGRQDVITSAPWPRVAWRCRVRLATPRGVAEE
jgi:Protein of unknown function (DUF3303)